MQLDATNLCGPTFAGVCTLRDTYLAAPDLQRTCMRFMEATEPFPFLEIATTTGSCERVSKWAFLNSNFFVGKDDDSDFLLKILHWIKTYNLNGDIRRPERLLKLYIAIHAKCAADASPLDARNRTL